MRACDQAGARVVLVLALLSSMTLAGCGAKDAGVAPPGDEPDQGVAAAGENSSDDVVVEHSAWEQSGEGAGEGATELASPEIGQEEVPRERAAAEELVVEQTEPAASISASKALRSPLRADGVPRASEPATGAPGPIHSEPALRNPLRAAPAMEMAREMAPAMAMEMAPEMAGAAPAEAQSIEAVEPPLPGVPSAVPDRSARSLKATDTEPPPYSLMTVFYATDRRVVDAVAADQVKRRMFGPLVVAVGLTLIMVILGSLGWHRPLALGLAAVAGVTTLALGAYVVWENREGLQQVADPGVRYGNERGTVEYGTCQVTIPLSHETGEIERPTILRLEVREDVVKHVVLRATEPSPEEAFFEQLRSRVLSAPSPEVFIFVHGYNVTFDGAARRTAQIAHDVDFAGAPIFFSWPSQGGLLKYTVDENNVEWAVPHLRQFLIDVTRRSGARAVNLIAHSMGSRALTAALRDVRLELSEEAMFNQIILAAPDIDAEIFKRDLAPSLVRLARHVTLYASSNDQALIASRKVHGYARAGDSGAGVVVLPGIETIDVSTLDTSLLGHSYYGTSDPILVDIRQMIHFALPAAQRPFLLPRPYGDLTYWVFEKIRTTAARDLPRSRE